MAHKKILNCPTCYSLNINHRVFPGMRVVNYTTGVYNRYFRCGPEEKGQKHSEHEWMMSDGKPGTPGFYEELGDKEQD